MLKKRDLDKNRPDRTSDLWFLLGSICAILFLGSCLILGFINSTQGFPSADGIVKYNIEKEIIWIIDSSQNDGSDALTGRPHLVIWLCKTDTNGHYFWKKLIDIPWFI